MEERMWQKIGAETASQSAEHAVRPFIDADLLHNALEVISIDHEDGVRALEDWGEWRAAHALADHVARDGWTPEVSDFFRSCSPVFKTAVLEATHFTEPYSGIGRGRNDEYCLAKAEDVVAHYREEVDRFPEAALAFALSAMDSGLNRLVGREVMRVLVEKQGWEYVFEQVCVGNVYDYAHSRVVAPIACVIECARVFGTPRSLPIALLERYGDVSENALDRLHFEALVDERRRVESLEGLTDNTLRTVLSGQSEVRWWDDDKAYRLVFDIVGQNVEERERFTAWLARDGRARGKDDVKLKGLLAWDYLVARYNEERTANNAQGDAITLWQDRIESVLFSDEELRVRVCAFIREDDHAYAVVDREWRNATYARYEAGRHMDTMGVADLLLSYVREGSSLHDPYTYAQSSYVLPIAHDTIALFDPEGHFLDVATPAGNAQRGNERPETLPPTEQIVGMLSALHDVGYGEEDRAVACALIYWDILPTDLRDELRTHYETLGLSVESHVADMRILDYDGVIRHSEAYKGGVPTHLYDRLSKYALHLYQEAGLYQKPVRMLPAETFAVGANSEYGGKGIRGSRVRELFATMQFDVVRFLTETVGVPLGILSRREYFELLVFLDTRRDGLKELRQIIASGATEEARKNRIHALLMLEEGDDAANTILTLVEGYPSEALDHLFACYGALTQSCDTLSSYLCETYGCLDNSPACDTVARISLRGMKRGAALLRAQAQSVTDRSGPELLSDAVLAVDADLALLSDSYREMKRFDPTLTLEKLGSVSIETLDNAAVRERPNLMRQLEEIYRENWHDVSEEAARSLVEKLRAHIAGEGRMYVSTFTRNGTEHVLAFASVVHEGDATSFVSALNRNPQLEVGGMGRVVLERVLASEAKGRVVHADVVHDSEPERAYINIYDFVGTRLYREEGTSMWVMDISLDLRSSAKLFSKCWRTSAEARKRVHDCPPDQIRMVSFVSTENLKSTLEEGFVLSKIFPDGLAVCERLL